MADRDQLLNVEIKAGRLVISVGIDALMESVCNGAEWDVDNEIMDADAFAIEIADRLENEEGDDGLTDLQRALDNAAVAAFGLGSEAVRAGSGEADDDR